MIVVSHHVFISTPLSVRDFPNDTVLRVNLAWEKDLAGAQETLINLDRWNVYLDYPQGRTKPPKPTITQQQAITLANAYTHVKYFAVSNVEDAIALNAIREQLRGNIEIVPKIETLNGIKNLATILTNVPIEFVMLDKEDLYLDVNKDIEVYEQCIAEARKQCKKAKITLLELQGVLFA